MLKNWLWM